jgi:[ribosomal protein S18]-alanine N-acetyltransferase
VTPATTVDASFRSATQGDVPAVVAIECISFGDPWSEATFRDLLRLRHAIFLVATEGRGGSVCGYVIAAVVAGEAEVLNLAVAPQWRGRGLGGRLLDAGLGIVGERGAREVFLEVRESNSAALALYTSRGFATLTRRAKYYRNPVEDALVLRRAVEG